MAQRRRRRPPRRPRRRRYHGRGRLTVLTRFLSFLVICSAIAAALILFFKTQNFVVSGNRRYTEQEIIDTMDAANYVGGAREIVDKMVEAAESTVGRKVE